MSDQLSNSQSNPRTYNLEERTARFAELTIKMVRKIAITPINKRIIEQLVGAAGSIGANYSEATEAESKKDFIHKIGICKKETKESKHWLRLLAYAHTEMKDEIHFLWKEAHELLLIFSKTISTSRKPAIEN